MPITSGFQVQPRQAGPLALAQMPILTGNINPSAFSQDLVTPTVQGIAMGRDLAKPLVDAMAEMTPEKREERALKKRAMELEGKKIERELSPEAQEAVRLQNELKKIELQEALSPEAAQSRKDKIATEQAQSKYMRSLWESPDDGNLSAVQKKLRNKTFNLKDFDEDAKSAAIKKLGEVGAYRSGMTDEEIYVAAKRLAEKTATARPMEKTAAENLSGGIAAMQQLDDLGIKIKIPEIQEMSGPVAGRFSIGPYNKTREGFKSQLRTVRQMIGKFLEGGVLRKEDESKYEEMLPKIEDLPSVQEEKLANVKGALLRKYQADLSGYESAGFDISRFQKGSDKKEKSDQLGKTGAGFTSEQAEEIRALLQNPAAQKDPRFAEMTEKLKAYDESK